MVRGDPGAQLTVIAITTQSFNAHMEDIRGILRVRSRAIAPYYGTGEEKEGGNAFREKRKPDFRNPKRR